MAEQVEEARDGEQQMQLLEQNGRYPAAELWRPIMELHWYIYVRACPLHLDCNSSVAGRLELQL